MVFAELGTHHILIDASQRYAVLPTGHHGVFSTLHVYFVYYVTRHLFLKRVNNKNYCEINIQLFKLVFTPIPPYSVREVGEGWREKET